MANNKVKDRQGNVLLDLTGDTATADKVVTGYTFHDKSGVQQTGQYAGIIPTGKIYLTDLTTFDVAAYASAEISDQYLLAENIKSGVTILGVSGSYTGLVPSGSIGISGTSPVDVTSKASAYIDVANITNLTPANIVKDVTILGITGTAEAGTGTGDAKLNTPTTSLGSYDKTNDYFYIYNNNNGNFVTYYDIYKDGVLLTTVSGSTSTVTVALRQYISVDGTYSITVVARGIGMADSNASTAVSYTHYTYVNVSNTLVNCSNTNNATETTKGSSYSATLSPASGYSWVGATIQITMGGTDVTSTALTNGNEISIANVTGDIAIVASFVAITQLSAPVITDTSGVISWSAVSNATEYGIYANGSLKDTTSSLSYDLSELTFGAEDTYTITVRAKARGYSDSNDSNSTSYEYSGSTVDSTLANNTWDVIKSVCEGGNASSFWAVGDTKNVTGGDNASRPVMIVDMQGLYSKHVVFQYRYRTEQNYVWASNNVNDYENSGMHTTLLQSGGDVWNELLDSDLKSALTNTTFQVCKGGNDGTLVSVTSKLFLPAEKEVGYTSYSRSEEQAALTTFQYYVSHNTQEDHKIPRPSAVGQTSGNMWWLRSPNSGNTGVVCYVNSSGNAKYNYANNSYGAAPCFAW